MGLIYFCFDAIMVELTVRSSTLAEFKRALIFIGKGVKSMGNLIWVAAGVAAAKRRNGGSSSGGGGDGDILFLILLLIMIAPMVLIFSIVLWPVVTLVITFLFIQFIREAVKEAKELSRDEKGKLKKRCVIRAIGFVVALLLNIPWWIWVRPNF